MGSDVAATAVWRMWDTIDSQLGGNYRAADGGGQGSRADADSSFDNNTGNRFMRDLRW